MLRLQNMHVPNMLRTARAAVGSVGVHGFLQHDKRAFAGSVSRNRRGIVQGSEVANTCAGLHADATVST